jgi:CelD/BcsL family acetyltransferase involved in cellulose biosynthesis
MASPVSDAGSAAITAAPAVVPFVAAEEAKGAEPRDALVVDLYRSFADLAPFRAEWDDFMEAIGAEIFLTHDWLATWWKYYGKDRPLLIACMRHRGALIAALPLYLDRISLGAFSLRVIRIVGSIYMPVTLTLPVQRSRLAEALPRLIAVVSDEWRWDLIHLGVLSGKCEVIPQIRDALASCHPLVEEPVIRQTGVQTYFDLEADWDAYVARLNKSKRKRLKNCLKEITKNNYVVSSHLSGAEDFSVHFEAFHRQHQDHWRDRGLPGHFRDWPDAYAFHREVAATSLNRDRLRLLAIHVNGKIAGYEYMYKFAQTYNSFLGSRGPLDEKKGITYGRVAFYQKYILAMRDNVNCIDSMRGHYPHKVELGGHEKPTHDVLVLNRRRHTTAKAKLAMRLFRLIDVLYAKLWRRRIAPRLGVLPGCPPDLWLRTHPLAHR